MNRKSAEEQAFPGCIGLHAVVSLALALHASASAADEIPQLASLMGWKTGTVVADIGAGDGSYAFAAVEHVGATGKRVCDGN